MNENKRLIYADDLLNEMEAGCIPIHEKGISGVLGDESCIKDYIDNAPTVEAPCEQIKWERDTAIKQLESYGVKFCENAEVEKVVHARWEINCDGYYPYCSRCKSEPQGHIMTDYCPNCGAKMDLEE